MRAERESFQQSVLPHWTAMHRTAARLAGQVNADDVLQEALLEAWRHRGRFDSARGELGSWLVGITVNCARRRLRALARGRPPQGWADPPAMHSASTSVESGIDVQDALEVLPDRQRLAVELFYFVGLPQSEVAAVMDCAEGTVKSTLAAARENLRSCLGAMYGA